EIARIHLERRVLAALEFSDTGLLDVEAERLEALAEFDGERQPDITETDDGETTSAKIWCFHGEFEFLGVQGPDRTRRLSAGVPRCHRRSRKTETCITQAPPRDPRPKARLYRAMPSTPYDRRTSE